MIESKEPQSRDIPIWLTLIILLGCLGGGGYLIYNYMQPKARQTVDITDEVKNMPQPGRTGGGNPYRQLFNAGNRTDRGGGGNRTPPRDLSANGVQPFGSSSFRVKSGNTVMVAPATVGARQVDLSYYKPVRTSEQEQLAMMFIAVRGESAWREFLNVTDEQRAQFLKVPLGLSGPAPMKIDPADRTHMATLWKAYREAAPKGGPDKAAAEKALLEGLDAIGQKNLPLTKDFEEKRTEAIRAAFTPEQVKKFLSYGSDRPPLKAATPDSGGATGITAPAAEKPKLKATTRPTTRAEVSKQATPTAASPPIR